MLLVVALVLAAMLAMSALPAMAKGTKFYTGGQNTTVAHCNQLPPQQGVEVQNKNAFSGPQIGFRGTPSSRTSC
jgi:hypothetical protein